MNDHSLRNYTDHASTLSDPNAIHDDEYDVDEFDEYDVDEYDDDEYDVDEYDDDDGECPCFDCVHRYHIARGFLGFQMDDHEIWNVITDPNMSMKVRRKILSTCNVNCLKNACNRYGYSVDNHTMLLDYLCPAIKPSLTLLELAICAILKSEELTNKLLNDIRDNPFCSDISSTQYLDVLHEHIHGDYHLTYGIPIQRHHGLLMELIKVIDDLYHETHTNMYIAEINKDERAKMKDYDLRVEKILQERGESNILYEYDEEYDDECEECDEELSDDGSASDDDVAK